MSVKPLITCESNKIWVLNAWQDLAFDGINLTTFRNRLWLLNFKYITLSINLNKHFLSFKDMFYHVPLQGKKYTNI